MSSGTDGGARQQDTVLLIDDETDLLEELGDYLKTSGCRVVTAHNGPMGLSLLEETQPDVVVCDVSMPGMSGHEVLQAIRGRADHLATVPFLFLTAHTAIEDELKARGFGADDFIGKPEDLQRIAAKIRSRIDQAKRFARQAEQQVADVRQRMSAVAARRERKLLAAISHLAQQIDRLGRDIAKLHSLIDPKEDPEIAGLTKSAVASTERAALDARTASVIASMPLAPLDPSPRPCDPARVLQDTADGIMGSLRGFVAFSASSDLQTVYVDPRQIEAMTANMLVWAGSSFPGSELMAHAGESLVSGRKGLTLSFTITGRYHSPDEIKHSWDELNASRTVTGTEDPVRTCALENIEDIAMHGGTASADVVGEGTQIRLSIPLP